MQSDDSDDEAPSLVAIDIEEVVVAKEPVEEEDLPPCPVTILSGFLGSGKTTLIRYILRSPEHGKRIAVIENEFGDGLDVESMIARDGADNKNLIDLIELPNGCICCTVKDSLVVTLEALLEKRRDLDYILIECSGMANPGPIASLFWLDDAVGSRLTLDGIVTVADSANIEEQLDTTEEAIQQLAYAERILLNKTDLIDNERLEHVVHRIRQVHPTAPIRKTQYSSVPDLDWVLGTKSFDVDRVKELEKTLDHAVNEATGDHDHGHDHGKTCEICRPIHKHTDAVSTVSMKLNGSVNLERLNRWLAEELWPNQDEQDKVLRAKLESGANGMDDDRVTPKIFRIKGILSVKKDLDSPDYEAEFVQDGLDHRRHVVQAVHDLWEIYPASRELNWMPNEERQCKVVVIGRRLNEDKLRRGFEACAV